MDNSSTKEKEMTVSDFSKQLKEGTKKSHSMAENTSFVASFLRGVVDEIKYRQLVANFYFIYHALESEMNMNKDNDSDRSYYVDLISASGFEFTGHDERGQIQIQLVET